MKRIFAAAAAVLLLSSCDTYEQDDPYGVPYPPQDPYGAPAPYPPQDPYGTPPPYPPQQQPYPPIEPVNACPVASTGGWQAWVNARPAGGERPTLHVTGRVVTPGGAYRVEFVPNLEERRSYPIQVVARMWVMAPTGGATAPAQTHDVRWQWPLASGPVGSLTVTCGDRVLVENLPVRTVE